MTTFASALKPVLCIFLNELKLYPAGTHDDGAQWQSCAMDNDAQKLNRPSR
jgi:hypothetical protein